MKKIIKILPFILLIVYMIIAFGFVSAERENVICSEVNIIIQDSVSRTFYRTDDIKNELLNLRMKLVGYPLYSLNTRKMEEVIKNKPYIRDVKVFTTISGSLEVVITQREPVVRVFTNESRSYYLDEKGNVMPESKNFTPFILVANGYFPGGNEVLNSGNIFSLKDRKKYKVWFELLELVTKINEDYLWKNQFVQIYLNRNGQFELIPRVGAHVIVFGDISESDEKFNKLKTLYFKAFSTEGWNNYEKIDLRYKNQVVCTKR